MNHAAASTPKVVTDGLLLDQGETEMRPMPAPSATSAKANAEATNAPAIMAAHDTAETLSAGVAADNGARVSSVISVMTFESPRSRDETGSRRSWLFEWMIF
jgi:hypothetical protein